MKVRNFAPRSGALRGRVLLLSLDWMRPKDPRVTLGHASILARLQREPSLQVRELGVAVNAPDFDRERLLAALWRLLEEPGWTLAIGVYVWNEAVVRWLLPELRALGFGGQVVLGGPQLSYAPPGVGERYPQANAIIRGYGEDALVELLTSEAGAVIPGVSWKGSVDLGINAAVALDALPSPILSGVLPVQSFMRWETQRGCRFACTFCQHREAGARLKRSTLSSERVSAEIEALVYGGAQEIAVLDPIFHDNPDAVGILQRFAELGYTGRLSLQCRFETLTSAFLDACEALDVLLEFGLQTIHHSEMVASGRMNKLGKVEAQIQELHRRGLPFEVSLIYGLPTQTLVSFQETVRWCQERGVPVLKAFPLMLLRGTKMEKDRARWGLVESQDCIPLVVESDSFSREDWARMAALAEGLRALPKKGAA